LGRVKGHLVSLPIGDEFVTVKIGDLVQVSLRTKDAQEAKRLHAAADAALRQRWELERTGPTPLSQLQVRALAADWRRAIVAEYRKNPGDPEGWDASLSLMAEALELSRRGRAESARLRRSFERTSSWKGAG
jgi:hypothetical protein